MALSLKKLINSVLEKEDWRLDLARDWNTIVGSLKTRVRLEKVYDDTLVIGVYEYQWMQELYLLSPVLKQQINEYLKKDRINHIRLKLVEDRKRKPIAPKTKPLVRPKKVCLNSIQENALNEIPDTALQNSLVDFLGRCLAKESS